MRRQVKRERPASAPRRRGRPPSAAARRRILEAARQMLVDGGPGGITMEALAARAGVGKPTIYRWWPDRHAVTMAALMDEAPPPPAGRPARSALRQLRRQLHAIVERFATPTGRHVAQLIAAADAESELAKAFRNHFVMARRTEGVALLHEAAAAGEITRSIDVEVTADLLYGAVFFRLLMGHARLDARFADAALAQLIDDRAMAV